MASLALAEAEVSAAHSAGRIGAVADESLVVNSPDSPIEEPVVDAAAEKIDYVEEAMVG